MSKGEINLVAASYGFKVHANPSGLIDLAQHDEVERSDEWSLSNWLRQFASKFNGRWWVGQPEIKASEMEEALKFAAQNREYNVAYINGQHESGVYVGIGRPEQLRTYLFKQLQATA